MTERGKGVTFVETTLLEAKTRRWDVIGTGGPDDLIGVVKWRGQWRTYAFHAEPGSDPILAPNCLAQLSEFCTEQSKAFWQSKRQRPLQDWVDASSMIDEPGTVLIPGRTDDQPCLSCGGDLLRANLTGDGGPCHVGGSRA